MPDHMQLRCDVARLRAHVSGLPDAIPGHILAQVPLELIGPLERVLTHLDGALGQKWETRKPANDQTETTPNE
jgi:hypothetical protein